MALTATSTNAAAAGGPARTTDRGLLLLVVAVFFLFGGITNLNDVLVPKLKGLFQLSYFQAMLVQFAFFASYAVFSIPAGQIMARLGYVRGIVLGFGVMALACLLFVPASNSAAFLPFLLALFMLGAGITLLQVAVNPLILSLGPPETASSRLTFAQFFNSLGVFLMVRIGAQAILGARAAAADPAKLSAGALDAYRSGETAIVGRVYLGIAAVLAVVALVFWLRRGALASTRVAAVRFAESFALLKHPGLAWGVAGIFVYVGAEVGIASIMIAYLGQPRTMALDPQTAGKLLSYYWLGALIGRFVGGALLRQVRAGWLLGAFAGIAIALIATSAFTSGDTAGYALIAIGLFNSIMFPTIFSLAVRGLDEHAPQASGLLCTAIVGGAIVPLAVGLTADNFGLSAALIVPALCYALIAFIGLRAAGANPIAS